MNIIQQLQLIRKIFHWKWKIRRVLNHLDFFLFFLFKKPLRDSEEIEKNKL